MTEKGVVYVLDAETLISIRRISDHANGVSVVRFNPSGDRLLVATRADTSHKRRTDVRATFAGAGFAAGAGNLTFGKSSSTKDPFESSPKMPGQAGSIKKTGSIASRMSSPLGGFTSGKDAKSKGSSPGQGQGHGSLSVYRANTLQFPWTRVNIEFKTDR